MMQEITNTSAFAKVMEVVNTQQRAAINMVLEQEQMQTVLDALPADTVRLDVGAYADDEALLRGWIQAMPNSDSADDVASMDCDDLEDTLDDLLYDLQEDGQRICVAFHHFDVVEEHWSADLLGWLREQITQAQICTCLVLSEKPLVTITEKPIGSSPLHNVFRVIEVKDEE